MGASSDDHLNLLTVVGARRLRVTRDRDFTHQEWVNSTPSRLADYRYVAFSSPKRSPVITVDVDAPYDHDRIGDLAATPNWIGINRFNGHSQYVWYLEETVYSDGRARRYHDAVARGLTSTVDGDANFTRNLGRNPLDISGQYEWHSQSHKTYSLAELHGSIKDDSDSLPKPLQRSGATLLPIDSDGLLMRKVHLWDVGRFEGYRLRSLGQIVDIDDVRAVMESANAEIAASHVKGPVSGREILATARSITRFCNDRLIPGQGTGGALFTYEQCVRGGQVQGARNAASGVLQSARDASVAVRSANSILTGVHIRMLRDQGMSYDSIAAQLSVSRSTVKRALSTAL
jgi:hypothetical protein